MNVTLVLFLHIGWVVGSLEILGSPASLVRSIGNGIADFFRLPYEGLTRGPGAFVSGVSRGTTSFVKHISKGRSFTSLLLPLPCCHALLKNVLKSKMKLPAALFALLDCKEMQGG